MRMVRRLVALLAIQGLLTARLPAGWRNLTGVGVALIVVSLALGLRLALAPWLNGTQFITFFPAVIMAALLGGSVAGLASVAMSALAAAITFSAPGIGNAVLLFVVVACMDVAIISALLEAIAQSRASEIRVGRLNADLATSDARFRDLLENAPDAMVIADPDTRIVFANASALRMFGYDRADELLGRTVDALIPQAGRGAHPGYFARFAAHPGPRRMGENQELVGLRRDGVEFPVETNLSMLQGDDGWLVCSTIRDVTWRKAGEARQALLIRELNHRVKNTLAAVQAVVSQTIRSAATPKAFETAITARLMALSQSHDVLTRSDWLGAEVRDIVAEQLSPYESSEAGRFSLEGPCVKLQPNRAVTLGMALGELTTNAAKYGALSEQHGSVDVRWSRVDDSDGPRLRLSWIERGGPAVDPPTRTGFGTRLIERSVTASLQGEVQTTYARSGVSLVMEFPLLKEEA